MYDAVIVVCCYSGVQGETALCLNRLRQRSNFTWGLQVRAGDALIGRSGSIEASNFLRSKAAPYMMFLDEDITIAAAGTTPSTSD